jgi:hypothetical protein
MECDTLDDFDDTAEVEFQIAIGDELGTITLPVGSAICEHLKGMRILVGIECDLDVKVFDCEAEMARLLGHASHRCPKPLCFEGDLEFRDDRGEP